MSQNSAFSAPKVALTIAGSDCSGGAGLQADLKTFQHFRLHGLTAVTCVVSETANIVRAVHPVPPALVADQVALLLEAFPVAAIKTGMLYSADHITAVAVVLAQYPHVPVVVDPVMIASTGASLLEPGAIELYRKEMFPLAAVITPNLDEAAFLLGRPLHQLADLPAAARELAATLNAAVLLKGGHLAGPTCLDVLCTRDGEFHSFVAPRVATAASHGTGCTLSAAIAARLALGDALPEAVAAAKEYLTGCLIHSYSFAGLLHALNQGTV
jgi:hydroxymethylpyrimidine/phosphomethylpyrimidine kinase